MDLKKKTQLLDGHSKTKTDQAKAIRKAEEDNNELKERNETLEKEKQQF